MAYDFQVTFDCADPHTLADWWADALGWEVERLLGIGATEVWDLRGKYGPGTGWVTLADPEGNEFCILRSPMELEAATTEP